MPGPTTEILNDDIRALREDIHKLDLGLTEVRTELRIFIKLAKWGIGIIATTLITSTIASIWWASQINTEVHRLGQDMAEVRSDLRDIRTVVGVTPKAPTR